jgi:eukaryotic-like serine/threonine-protein kinase
VDFDLDELSAQLGGRYRMGSQIGEGAQGVVFAGTRLQALDGTEAEEKVALKIYTDPDQDERVRREINAMLALRDRTLASLIEFGQVQLGGRDYQYGTWEFIEGTPLDQRIRTGALPANVVAAVGRDVSRAIGTLWSRRIVHRDISPKNVIVRAGDREAVLLDLGIARHLSQGTLTAHGFWCGTPGYLSPEQAQARRDLTCRSDVFAAGVVLQEALAGRHPTNWDPYAMLSGVPPTADIAPDAPARLAMIIDSMVNPIAVRRPLPETLVDQFTNYLDPR